ncbi:MAG TPA: histidine kinase [Chthoniobacterales bacterium]
MSSQPGRVHFCGKLQLAGFLAIYLGTFVIRLHVAAYDNSALDALRDGAFALLFSDAVCLLLVVGLRYFYQLNYFQHIDWSELVLVIGPIAFVLSIIHLGLTLPASPFARRIQNSTDPEFLLAAAIWPRFWFFSTVSLLYFLLNGIQANKQLTLALKDTDNHRRRAELLMLRSHMNPHFLFNALNTIVSESDSNPRLALVARGFSDYMRYALAKRKNLFVTLGDEIDALSRYVDVERARFGEALSIDIKIDPPTLSLPVPGLFLQPLVENAIKHGRQVSCQPLSIVVETQLDDRKLILRVSNSGSWIYSNRDQPEHSPGAGLEILRRQLALIYAERSHFKIGSKGDWTVAEITLEDPAGAARETHSRLSQIPL